jgi:hypothetical protein
MAPGTEPVLRDKAVLIDNKLLRDIMRREDNNLSPSNKTKINNKETHLILNSKIIMINGSNNLLNHFGKL